MPVRESRGFKLPSNFQLVNFYPCFFPPHLLTFQTKKNPSTATYGYALLYLCIQIIQGEDPCHHFATEASAPVVRSHRRQMHVLEPRRVDVETPVDNGMNYQDLNCIMMKFVSFCYILESFCHLGMLHNKGSDSEIVAHLCNRMPYVSFCYVVMPPDSILFFLSLDLAT